MGADPGTLGGLVQAQVLNVRNGSIAAQQLRMECGQSCASLRACSIRAILPAPLTSMGGTMSGQSNGSRSGAPSMAGRV